ncbi:MAG: CoA-binding protein [Chloroflexota bacterium]
MSSTLQVKVDDFLSQRRIAIAGVSRNPSGGAAANGIYRRFRDLGYQVYAVNPNADEVEGDPCYHTVKDIPEHVDGVIIATPAGAADGIVQDCAEAGITRVWMHNGIHSLGTSVSERAVEFCQQHNISVIAGACPLMFGKTSDGFHRLVRTGMGIFGQLPN